MDVIRVVNVEKWYRNEKVLDGVSLSVGKGEVIGIVGPNGCGKTTLLRIIAGLTDYDSGEVFISGKLGFVFQEDLLLPWRTIRDNVLIGLKIRGAKDFEQEKKLQLVSRLLGIEEHLNKYPTQVSGGTARKTAIARALVLDPDVLLLDEPYTGLDARSTESLQATLTELKKVKKLSMIIVSHQLDELVEIADKIYVLTPRPSRVKTAIDLVEEGVDGVLKKAFR